MNLTIVMTGVVFRLRALNAWLLMDVLLAAGKDIKSSENRKKKRYTH